MMRYFIKSVSSAFQSCRKGAAQMYYFLQVQKRKYHGLIRQNGGLGWIRNQKQNFRKLGTKKTVTDKPKYLLETYIHGLLTKHEVNMAWYPFCLLIDWDGVYRQQQQQQGLFELQNYLLLLKPAMLVTQNN